MARVLLVEDEGVLRRSLRVILTRSGFEVIEASNLRDAQLLLESHDVDGAMLDVCLPDGSGLDLIGQVTPQKAVVMSAQSDADRYAACGVVHRMDKPLDLARSVQLLRDVVEAGAAP